MLVGVDGHLEKGKVFAAVFFGTPVRNERAKLVVFFHVVVVQLSVASHFLIHAAIDVMFLSKL